MLVSMAPSTVQADIEVRVEGDQLKGELVFRYSNVSLHVDELSDMAGGKNIAIQMNEGLARLNRFESRIRLGGTLDNYTFDSQSNLGEQFANCVNQTLGDRKVRNQQLVEQQLDTALKNQLDRIDNQVLPTIQRITNAIQSKKAEFAELDNLQKQSYFK